MSTTELLALFRSEVFDLELPYLWSDDLVYRYIDDAQKQFCRDTNGIADSRSYTVSVVPGTEWYTYDTKILKIRDAIVRSTGLDMPIIAVEKMAENHMRFDGNVGTPRALVSGLVTQSSVLPGSTCRSSPLKRWPRTTCVSTATSVVPGR